MNEMEKKKRKGIKKQKKLTLFESGGVKRCDATGFLLVSQTGGNVGRAARIELNGRSGGERVATLKRRAVLVQGRALDRVEATVDAEIRGDVVIVPLALGHSADDARRVCPAPPVDVERVVGRGCGDARPAVVVVIHPSRRVIDEESRARLAALVVGDGARYVDGVRVVGVGHGRVHSLSAAILSGRGGRGGRDRRRYARQGWLASAPAATEAPATEAPAAAAAQGSVGGWRGAAVLRPLHLAGRVNDQFDPVGSFVVGAASTHRLAEIVQHGPWCPRQVA